ncbi:MAG TPA: phosphopentomutase [Anaerolineaceae bacterium]
MSFRRAVVIVLDGVGAGEAPDAQDYGDVGSNSLSNVARAVNGLKMPNLEKLGWGYVTPMQGVRKVENPGGAFGRLIPTSVGKDSITGHWELMGVFLTKALPTYPNGFPQDVLDEFKRLTGYDVLGNKPASGTEILKELGEEHMRTGKPILYTSADSVFQIAAHEEVIPLERLYETCRIARKMLVGDHAVGRVIARPFLGSSAETFKRTNNRRDFPLDPIADTMMDKLIASGRSVYATGKIDDLFAGRGITVTSHSEDNVSSTNAMLEFLEKDFEGLLFTNLVEFDMIYGHRNDARGYANALEAFDAHIPDILARLKAEDVVMVVADHGVDPTTPGTDHSRECSPLLVFGPRVRANVNLGDRGAYSDVAATLAEIFQLETPSRGKSFLTEIRP